MTNNKLRRRSRPICAGRLSNFSLISKPIGLSGSDSRVESCSRLRLLWRLHWESKCSFNCCTHLWSWRGKGVIPYPIIMNIAHLVMSDRDKGGNTAHLIPLTPFSLHSYYLFIARILIFTHHLNSSPHHSAIVQHTSYLALTVLPYRDEFSTTRFVRPDRSILAFKNS